MRGREFANRLVDQAESEMLGPERRGIVRLGRSAGADVAELGAREVGKASACRKGVPVERLLGEGSRERAHFAREWTRRLRQEAGVRHVSFLRLEKLSLPMRSGRASAKFRQPPREPLP